MDKSVCKNKYLRKKNIVILFLLPTWLVGIYIFFYSSDSKSENTFNKEKAINLYPQAVLSVQNCEHTGDRFFTLHNDPQIYISPPEYKISSTLIEFSDPISIDSSVQVYYAEKNKNLSEQYSVFISLPKGSSEIIINLPQSVFTALRYDIDIIGESYEIKGIYVSKSVKIRDYSIFLKTLIISVFIFLLWIIGIKIGKKNKILENIFKLIKELKQNKTLGKKIFLIIIIIVPLIIQSYFISDDLQDMLIKKMYEKRIDQQTLYNNLKDFSINGEIITSTSDDPFIFIDTSDIGIFKYIKLDIKLFGNNDYITQYFYATEERGFREADSKYKKLYNGVNYIKIPVERYVGVRLDLTNIEGISFSVKYVELTNKYSPKLSDLLFIFFLNIAWFGIWFIILYKDNSHFFMLKTLINLKYKLLSEKIIKNKRIYRNLFFCLCIILICLIGTSIYIFSFFNSTTAFFHYFTYFIFSIFFILVILIILLILKQVPIEYIYLVTGTGIGIFYLIIMTPFSVPDERHHYHSTHLLTNFLTFQENKYISTSSNFDYSNLSYHRNGSSAYMRLAKEGIKRVKDTKFINIPRSYDINYFFLYIPQSLGVLIARFLKLNFFGSFYFGRFTNLLFYVFCVFCAIKIVNEFKLPFFLIGLLPMSMHQAASFSYDTFINGISMVFIAYLIHILYEIDKLEKKDITFLSILGILLAPAKLIYFPIVSLVFLALPKYFGWKKKKGYILAAGIFIIGLAMIIIFHYNNLFKTTGLPELNWEGQNNYTLSFILENPMQTAKIFWNSFSLLRYIQDMFGRYLSGRSLTLPEWYINAFIFILIGSVFYGKKGSWKPKWWHRGLFLFILTIVIFLCMLSMFLFWTSDIHNTIRGVQGRYFIPLIPLGLLMLKSKLNIENKVYSFVLIGFAIGMQFLIIRYILNETIGF